MKRSPLDGYKTYDTSNGYGNPREWRGAFQQRMSLDEAQAIVDGQTQPPHEILGVPASHTEAQLLSAYRKLMKKWHPDKNMDNEEEAVAVSKKIIAAYEVLSNQLKAKQSNSNQ